MGDQPLLDMPELLWRSYINYECHYRRRKKARDLYERLLNKTQHIKVWLGYAAFGFNPLPLGMNKFKLSKKNYSGHCDETPRIREANARNVYKRGFKSLREQMPESKEEAVMILEAWYEFEKKCVEETHGKLEERLKV